MQLGIGEVIRIASTMPSNRSACWVPAAIDACQIKCIAKSTPNPVIALHARRRDPRVPQPRPIPEPYTTHLFRQKQFNRRAVPRRFIEHINKPKWRAAGEPRARHSEESIIITDGGRNIPPLRVVRAAHRHRFGNPASWRMLSR